MISVILSTRNRCRLLQQTLASFERLDTSAFTWELILVDNGSSDATPSIIERFADRLPIVYLHEPIPGKNRALNLALTAVRGDLAVFTDDDVVAERHWLRALQEASDRWPHDAVFGGRIVPRFPPQTPEWLANHTSAGPAFGSYAPEAPEGPVERHPYGANMMIRLTATQPLCFNEAVGPRPKNYAMGGEAELLMRLRARGHRFVYVPDAVVQHVIDEGQTSPHWLARRFYRLGRGSWHLQPPPRCDDPRTWLWPRARRELLRAWFRYSLSLHRGDEHRFEASTRLHSLFGRVDEHRLQAAARGTGNGRLWSILGPRQVANATFRRAPRVFLRAARLARMRRAPSPQLRAVARAIGHLLQPQLTLVERSMLDRIEDRVRDMAASDAQLVYRDFGAIAPERPRNHGARSIVVKRTVSQIARTAPLPEKWRVFLFHLIRQLKPQTCVELGTSLGISAAYQASALKLNGSGALTTVEGAQPVAAWAGETFRCLELEPWVKLHVGPFSDTLPAILESHTSIDFAFIDGHHSGVATLDYFETLLRHSAKQATFVFDDIMWSADMNRAWSKIANHPATDFTVTIGPLGICTFSPFPRKKHYNIPN